jgi:hypothetical protein
MLSVVIFSLIMSLGSTYSFSQIIFTLVSEVINILGEGCNSPDQWQISKVFPSHQ